MFPRRAEISSHSRGEVVCMRVPVYLAEATKPPPPASSSRSVFLIGNEATICHVQYNKGKAATLQYIPAETQPYHESFQLRWRQTSTRVLKILISMIRPRLNTRLPSSSENVSSLKPIFPRFTSSTRPDLLPNYSLEYRDLLYALKNGALQIY